MGLPGPRVRGYTGKGGEGGQSRVIGGMRNTVGGWRLANKSERLRSVTHGDGEGQLVKERAGLGLRLGP